MNEKPQKIRLKRRERKFVTNFVNQGLENGKQAAILAGYSSSNASLQANRMLQRPTIQQEIHRILEEKGNPEDFVSDIIYEIGRNPNSTPEQKLKAAQLMMKIRGHEAPSKHMHVSKKLNLPE